MGKGTSRDFTNVSGTLTELLNFLRFELFQNTVFTVVPQYCRIQSVQADAWCGDRWNGVRTECVPVLHVPVLHVARAFSTEVAQKLPEVHE